MKRFLMCAILLCAAASFLTGCAKKSEEPGEEPMSMETLSTLNATQETNIPASTTVPPSPSQAVLPAAEPKLEPLPPAGPYKPTSTEIQTALKNAGFYTGAIDGKIGPMSKKAIEAFQQANGLTVDGKVGPKTWALLSKYLNPAASVAAPATSKPGVKSAR